MNIITASQVFQGSEVYFASTNAVNIGFAAKARPSINKTFPLFVSFNYQKEGFFVEASLLRPV